MSIKNSLIQLLGGHTAEEMQVLKNRLVLVNNPALESFNIGDRVVFYYWAHNPRGLRSYGSFNYGTIRRIETINSESGSRSTYQIDTSKEKRQFAYDFELDTSIMSKDINVLRCKLLHSDSFLPVQNETYGAPNGVNLDI